MTNLKTIFKKPIDPRHRHTKSEWVKKLRRNSDDHLVKQLDENVLFDGQGRALYGDEHVAAVKELVREIKARREAEGSVEEEVAKPLMPAVEQEGHYEFVNTGKGGQERFWITAKPM